MVSKENKVLASIACTSESQCDHFGCYIKKLLYVIRFSFQMKKIASVDILTLLCPILILDISYTKQEHDRIFSFNMKFVSMSPSGDTREISVMNV